MLKKVLITGSNGQLGSEIFMLKDLYDFEFHFTDIDQLDLTKEQAALNYLEKLNPDYIVNCAAYTAVDKAESEPELAEAVNALIPEILHTYCVKSNKRLIHISTDYVFDGSNHIPYKEEDPTCPESAYGKSKLDGERKLAGSKNAIIIRTSWLYSSFGGNFVKSMLRLFNEKEILSVVYDQVGSPTYATDLANAILNIIQQGEKNFVSGIYHYSNEGVTSWFDFAYAIKELSGSMIKLSPIESKDYPTLAKRPFYSVLNKEKIKHTYQLEVPYWKDSLKKCIDILLRN